MEYQAFEQLVLKVRGCYFSGSKRDAINKSIGALTAQQIYRLQGQFTGGNDRVHVVTDLKSSQRILPMTAIDAEPIIKMGIYTGQKKSLLKLLAKHIADRQQTAARQLLGRNFTGADSSWMFRELDQAGPYEGPPPVSTITGPGPTIITSNIVLTNPVGTHYQQDPISYAGNALFGGLLTAHVPTSTPTTVTAVSYPGIVQPGQQYVQYPQVNPYPMAAHPAAAAAVPSNLYPSLSAHGAAPPAYSPADANPYPQSTQYATAPEYPPQSNITYPPTESGAPSYQDNQLPPKTPVA